MTGLTLADGVAAILLLALTAYAVLAGADFGGGVWDLFASGPRLKAQRTAVAAAMGPVWEANHVWLIFLLVGLFTAFPTVFAALSTGLYLPFTIALLGIILRGAPFTFQAHGYEAIGELAPWGFVFGAASIIAPAFLGAALGAVAVGAVRAGSAPDATAGWVSWLAADLGLLAVALAAYLAATYLMVETEGDLHCKPISAGARSAPPSSPASWPWPASCSPGARPHCLVRSHGSRHLAVADRADQRANRCLRGLARGAEGRADCGRGADGLRVVGVGGGSVACARSARLHHPRKRGARDDPAALVITIAVGMVLLAPSLWLLFHVFKGRNPAAAVTDPSR